MIKTFFNRQKIHLGVFFIYLLIGFMTYSNSLHNPFMLDDHSLFTEKIKNTKFFGYHFIPDKGAFLGVKNMRNNYYRPLQDVTLMVFYQFFKDNPFDYHLINLVLLWLTVCLIYGLMWIISGKIFLAFLVGIFYLIHPISGVYVNYITASVFTIQVILLLGSLMCLWWSSEQKREAGFYYFLSLFLFGAALLYHETSMAFPFYALCFLFFKNIKNQREAVRKSIPFFCVLFFYFLCRMHYASLQDSILRKFGMFQMNWPEYAASLSKLIFWYISKLISPTGIILIRAIPVVREEIFPWIGGMSTLGGLFIFFLIYYKKDPVVQLGLLWFAIGFLPFSFACLFQPVHGLMLEPHWFSFPVIGFFIVLAFSIDKIFSIPQILTAGKEFKFRREIVVFCIAMTGVSWILLSRSYNKIWSNEKEYCHYWLKESSGLSAVMFYLAAAYARDHENSQAGYFYEQALKKNYKPWMTDINLGLLDIDENRLQDAKKHFQSALILNPYSAAALSNLGLVYLKGKDYKTAQTYFLRSIENDRSLIVPRLQLAKIYIIQGEKNEAIQTYEEILRYVPHHEASLIGLIQLYIEEKNSQKILQIARELVSYSLNPEALTNAGILLIFYNFPKEAQAAFQKAMQADPNYKESYWEMGKLYVKMNQLDRALAVWKRGLQIDPRDERFKKNIEKLSQNGF